MKMKRILGMAFAAMIAVGITSCAKEDVENGGTSPIDPNAKTMTFRIPASSGIITYSDRDQVGTVTANAAEKAINTADVKVYMFDATTKKLQAVFATPTIGQSGSNKTATIALDNTWASYDQDKHFYLAANTTSATSLSGVVADPTLVATGGGLATQLDDFLKLATVSQGTTHIMPVDGTPASYLLMTELVPNVDLETSTSEEVYFRRTVARFDIDNQVNTVGANTGGNVVIEEVKVYDANLQGFVFGYENRGNTAPNNIMSSSATGELPTVTVTATVDAGTGKQAQASLMYLYPTVIKADGTGTQIYLNGKVGLTNKTFTLKGAADITIESNKRYKITAIDELTLTFELMVADWDEGDDLTGTPGNGIGGFSLVATPSGTAFQAFNNNVVELKNDGNGGTVTFAVKATSSLGTSVVVTHDAAMTDHTASIHVVEAPSNTITYGTPYFASTYTVTIDPLTASEESFTTLTIKDKNDPSLEYVIGLYHPSAGNEGTVRINETTFPNAIFRSYVENTLHLSGIVTKTAFEAISEINISNKGITDVTGLKYFTNVETLTLSRNDVPEIDITGLSKVKLFNITGNTAIKTVDLSGCPDLVTGWLGDCSSLSSVNVKGCTNMETLIVQNSLITSLDVSTCTALKDLRVFGSKITSIDVTKCAALEALRIYSTPVTSIDARNLVNLDVIMTSDSPLLAYLNVTGCTVLRQISANNTNLTSLDVSTNPGLKVLQLNKAKLSTIDVSNNPLLEEFRIEAVPISTLNIANNSALTTLQISNTNLSTIDLTNNTELGGFFFSNTDITDINLTTNTKLKRLWVGDKLQSIDLSNQPSLSILVFGKFDSDSNIIGDAQISSLDISNNNLITDFRLSSCPNLNTVKVWSSFETSVPASNFTTYTVDGTTPTINYVK